LTVHELREIEEESILFCVSEDHPDVDAFFASYPETVAAGGVIQLALLEGANRPISDVEMDPGSYLMRGGHRPTSHGNSTTPPTVVDTSKPTNTMQASNSSSTNLNANGAELLALSGTVKYLPLHSEKWLPCPTNLMLFTGDKIRTMSESGANIRLTDKSVVRLEQLTTMEIDANPKKQGEIINLKSGSLYFFHRDAPREIQFKTPSATGAIKG
jgi:hypothetical protein